MDRAGRREEPGLTVARNLEFERVSPTQRPVKAPAGRQRPPRHTAFQQPRLIIMGGLLLLAGADYAGTYTGAVTHIGQGNVIYSAAAGLTTLALWALLPGYTTEQRRASRLARPAMYAGMLALHTLAAAVAWTPWHNPTALAVLDAAGTVAVVAVMTLVSVYAWWCRVAPLAEGS
jgi:hypothetical protein